MGPLTQEDPIGIAGGLNLYGYANGDPINFSDPFGLCPWCLGAAAGALVEGVSQVARRDFSLKRLVVAGGLGAASGGLSVASKVATGFRFAGQGAIGALGGLAGGGLGDPEFGFTDAALAAGFGMAGEGFGDLVTAGASSQAGRAALGTLRGQWAGRMEQAVSSGDLSAAQATGMTNALIDVLRNVESQIGGLTVGLIQSLRGNDDGN
jgi:hypothetical protein